jgi:cysteine-rich repeat protein
MLVRYLAGTCGNAVTEAGEDCDDGNVTGGDGCDANCCSADSDSDGTCDAIDPCTGGVAVTAAKIKVTRFADIPGFTSFRKDNVISITASLQLPFPFSPPLDALANGVRLIVNRPTQTIFDVTIPPGAAVGTPPVGWTVRQGALGPKWTWADKRKPAVCCVVPKVSRTPAGINKVLVEDKSGAVPGLVKITVKGLENYLIPHPPSAEQSPLSAVLILDSPTAAGGQCGTAAFPGPPPAPTCAFNAAMSSLTCK